MITLAYISIKVYCTDNAIINNIIVMPGLRVGVKVNRIIRLLNVLIGKKIVSGAYNSWLSYILENLFHKVTLVDEITCMVTYVASFLIHCFIMLIRKTITFKVYNLLSIKIKDSRLLYTSQKGNFH